MGEIVYAPSEALEGEVVGREVQRRTGLARGDGRLHYMIHVVDLPGGSGRRIDGMDRENAIAIAKVLGTHAYQALATLRIRDGLVVVEPIERIW